VKKYLYPYFLIQLMFLCCTLHSSAQDQPQARKSDFWNRISLGGNVGFQFGSVTSIIVAPEAMLRVVDQFYVGVGFTYQYSHYKDYYFNTHDTSYMNFSMNVYGGRIFLRYYLSSLFDNFLGNIFLHTEYEYLTYTRPYQYNPVSGYIYDPYYNAYTPGNEIIEVNSLFIGGGYKQPIGGKAYIDLMILYNLNDSYSSPYSNPLFRLGFGVGL
jgi:hypothetical protein